MTVRGTLYMTNSDGVTALLEFESKGWVMTDPRNIGKRFVGGEINEIMLHYDNGTVFRLGPGWELPEK